MNCGLEGASVESKPLRCQPGIPGGLPKSNTSTWLQLQWSQSGLLSYDCWIWREKVEGERVSWLWTYPVTVQSNLYRIQNIVVSETPPSCVANTAHCMCPHIQTQTNSEKCCVCVSLTQTLTTSENSPQQLHRFLLSVWKHYSEQLVEEITFRNYFLRIYIFSWNQWANCQSGWLLGQIFISISLNQFHTHSFICGGPPPYQHQPPHIDFLLLELHPVLTHSGQHPPVISTMLYTPTQWIMVWFLVYR